MEPIENEHFSAKERAELTEAVQPEELPEAKKKLSELRFSQVHGLRRLQWILNYVFIDGMSGMALGLFATLIAGTIVWQIGNLIDKGGNNFFGLLLESVGKIAQISMGAGIGVGICVKMKKTQPLVIASACAAGMIGSYAKAAIAAVTTVAAGGELSISLASAGDPMGAFVGAMASMILASSVSGKTKVDILVTPLVGLLGGSFFGIAVGYPVSLALTQLGNFIAWAASLSTLSAAITGLILAVVMGIALTLPISSAAIGISVGLSGVAAGAAVVGCCCQMIGFAVMSFRENRWSGLLAQGLGTSMLQIPNIFKKPVLFLPPILSSAILGPLSVLLPNGTETLGLLATKVGSGMGTAGLVGPIDLCFHMIGTCGCDVGLTLLWMLLFCFLFPAALTLAFSEILRRMHVIRPGDLKLDL